MRPCPAAAAAACDACTSRRAAPRVALWRRASQCQSLPRGRSRAAGERIAGMAHRAVHRLATQLPWGVHCVPAPSARGRCPAPCRCRPPASSANSLPPRLRLRRTAHAVASHARRWAVTPHAAASAAAAVTFVDGDDTRGHPTPADELTVLGVAALVFCDRCVCAATRANGGLCLSVGQAELTTLTACLLSPNLPFPQPAHLRRPVPAALLVRRPGRRVAGGAGVCCGPAVGSTPALRLVRHPG